MGHGILIVWRVIIKGSASPSHLYGRGRVNPSVAADSTCKAPATQKIMKIFKQSWPILPVTLV